MSNLETSAEQKTFYAKLASISALVAVTAMIVMKGWAWYITDSVGVLALLADSIMDAAVSVAVFYSIRYSVKPADDEHRHGHGKIEGMVALMQGALLFGAAVLLLLEAVSRLHSPEHIENHEIAMALIAFSIAVTAVLASIQLYAMKKTPSLAIEGDHAHYAGDIWINVAVLVALYVDQENGPVWIDPAVGAAVACYLVYSAKSVGHKGYDMLMDRELPSEERQKIIDTIEKEKRIAGWHDLRTRRSGMKLFIDMDIEINPELTLKKAHDIAEDIEAELLKLYPDAEVMIHMDPVGNPADSRHPKIHSNQREIV